jgi:asparagine synthase (glutamine-hydrolysing)
MSGICIVAGAADAPDRAARMAARFAAEGEQSPTIVLAPEVAAGLGSRGGRAGKSAAGSADGVTVLVDGEIYAETGPHPDPASVIADLYHKDRLDEAARLNGSFAAIVYDARSERLTFLTDRLGSRTLFVWHDGRRLAAASRLSALFGDDRVPARLSTQGMAELLSLQRTVADHTQYADVRAMPGAQVCALDGDRLSTRQTRRLHWSRPDFDEREGAERLAGALVRAARRCTGGPLRGGLLLSGGLDSRMVLAAIRAAGGRVPCVTVATWENGEVAVARRLAEMAGAPFHYRKTAPGDVLRTLDLATEASDGLFPAPTNLFGLLPALAEEHDVLLSGHGLDYTLRGYYLPCHMVRVAGSTTRLPRLRSIPDGAPATVVNSLRVGMNPHALRRTLASGLRQEIDARRISAMAAAQALADIEDPYDAWDAFVLHSLGRHYAYSDFVAMNRFVGHRAVAFDTDVFDLYLSMPAAWRASGRMARAAMKRLGPDLMALPDANNGLRADRPQAIQLGLTFTRAALRRLGLMRPPPVPDPTMTHGSWANYGELFRRDQTAVERLRALPRNAALMDTGLFDSAGLARVIDEHLSGARSHTKLLHQFLTLASWLAAHGYSEVCRDG